MHSSAPRDGDRWLPGILAVLFAALAIAGCAPSEGKGGAEADLGQWDEFEAVLDLPVDDANPFDPAAVDVVGEFRTPDGRAVTTPAFVTREYERRLEGGFEKLAPAGGLEWKVRFTPADRGTWSWRWRATHPDGSAPDLATSEWRTFRVGPPKEGRHGFLRPSPDDPRYLRFDDGTPYFAVGENLCWYDGRGTFAYDDWLAKLAAHGATYIRLWMPSWAFGLEWIERRPDGSAAESSLGNYASRLDRAWQLDHVLAVADELGIQVMLSIQNHGAFSTTSNSEWADNPYNQANGGPLAAAGEFFADEKARSLFRRRLRYLVARWGHATNLLAWELWNEVDLADSPGIPPVVDWHAEMAGELARLDPYRHPVTTSLSATSAILNLVLGTSVYDALWDLPGISFAQLHFYTIDGIPVDLSQALPALSGPLRNHGKPVLVAEAGVDFRGPAETLAADPESIGIHDMLWAGILAEAFGTGMTWWWDSVVDPEDLYPHFAAVSAFIEGVAFDREGFRAGGATASAPRRKLAAHVMGGRHTALAWIKNARHQWWSPDPSVIEDATVQLAGIADGPWLVRWIDPYAGLDVESTNVTVRDGTATLPVPPFARDIALRLERR